MWRFVLEGGRKAEDYVDGVVVGIDDPVLSALNMPFVRVHFTANDQAAAMDRQLDQTLGCLDRPITLTRQLLGLSTTSRGIARTLQSCWCVFLSATLLACWILSLVVLSPPLLLLHSAGLINFFLLVFWGRPNQQFKKALKSSSNGVGILRSLGQLQKITDVAYSSSAVFIFVVLILVFLSLFQVFPFFNVADIHVSLRISLAFGSILSSVVIPAAHSLFFSFIFRITAEYEALAHDFKRDSNVSQLPVCRHYFYAHRSLLKLFFAVKGPLELWLSSSLLLDVVVLFAVVRSSFNTDLTEIVEMWRLFIFGVLTCASVVHVLFLIIASIKLRCSMKCLRDGVLDHLVSRSTLDEQVYSLCGAFLQSLDSSLPSLVVFGLFPLRRSFSQLFLLFLLAVCLLFVLRIKD